MWQAMVAKVIITLSNGKQCHWQLTFWNIGNPVKYLAQMLRQCLSLEVGYVGKDQVVKKAEWRKKAVV